MYARSKTGISPEYVSFHGGNDFSIPSNAVSICYFFIFTQFTLDLHLNIPNDQPFYILRPEVVEAIYYLSFLTGDPIYREWSWEIWQSIEKYCKTKYGYGSLKHVDRTDSVEDRMESFFLAETMKYLYLIFDPDSEIDILHKVSNVLLPLNFFL